MIALIYPGTLRSALVFLIWQAIFEHCKWLTFPGGCLEDALHSTVVMGKVIHIQYCIYGRGRGLLTRETADCYLTLRIEVKPYYANSYVPCWYHSARHKRRFMLSNWKKCFFKQTGVWHHAWAHNVISSSTTENRCPVSPYSAASRSHRACTKSPSHPRIKERQLPEH